MEVRKKYITRVPFLDESEKSRPSSGGTTSAWMKYSIVCAASI